MRPTIYLHHDAYELKGDHLSVVNRQHRIEKYPKSIFGHFTFYQYFLERSGALIQTRPEMDPDVVYKKEHKDSISICLAGHMDRQAMESAQLNMLVNLFASFRCRYGTIPTDIKVHRDYQKTSCPGSNIWAKQFAHLFNDTIMPKYKQGIYRVVLDMQSSL